ncbi:MAG: 4'-phosphopantetheinyl transferase superfamily protein [Bryobacterales bacterium]|nr:4'-phosphopantetheinyl transferase superfamily protein [Bryobacterales bacterium]
MSPAEVQVWRVPLEGGGDPRVLSEQERERAARFRFERHRRRFTAAHTALRSILARATGELPGSLRFAFGPYGKPALESGRVRFNLSHSSEVALVALAVDREVGVDVERMRPEITAERIAERFFSPHEVEALRALPEERRFEAFFHCWTRKEAFIKARGEGFSHPLDSFDVSLVPGEPARLLATRPDAAEASRWSLAELPVPSGYTAALAVEGTSFQLAIYDWPGTITGVENVSYGRDRRHYGL